MKKILPLVGLATLAVGAVVGVSSIKPQTKEAKADEYESYITMESTFFTNWTNDAGMFKDAGASYHAGSYNAFGNFFDGCNGAGGTAEYEGWKGTLTSRKWKQHTEYIYYEWGCAKDYDVSADVKLVFKVYTSESDANPASYEVFNNTFSGCTMVLRNFKVPNFADFHGSDFYMSVDLFDDRTGDWGANIFGNLNVNQTHEQVSDAQFYYMKHCVGTGEKNIDDLRSHYRTNSTLRDGFIEGFSESFNTQASFEKHFMLDSYGRTSAQARHEDKAISTTSTYRTDNNGTNMPFNNESGFFKGWYGGGNGDTAGNEQGFVADDYDVYRFISKPFYLPENGIVSVKMAGNTASLHLLNFDDGTGELAWANCQTFNNTKNDDDLKNIANSGFNSCTLRRYVVNFSEFGGKLVRLGIADIEVPTVEDGGWTAVYFDELKADYIDELPGFKVDAVTQESDVTSHSAFPDIYVSSKTVTYAGGRAAPESDTSPLLPAYNAWIKYFNDVRGGKYGNNYCSIKTGAEVTGFLDAYNALTMQASKEIVCSSYDFERTGAGANWYNKSITLYTPAHQYNLAKSIQHLAHENGYVVTVYSSGVAMGDGNLNIDNSTIIIVLVFVGLLAGAGFLAFKKKKQEN